MKVRTVGSREVWKIGTCQTIVPHYATVAPGTPPRIREQLAACLGEDWLE
jgi:hypothetical protein